MDVAVVGAGAVGTAVAVLLSRAGHRIVAVSGREATAARAELHLPGVLVTDPVSAAAAAELVVVGVPDGAISVTVDAIAEAGAARPGQWWSHLSGATRLDALDAARDAGARRLSIHPLQTLPDVEIAVERLPGSAIAVTADDEAGASFGEQIARDLGGSPFRLADEDRALYHSAAVFASNALVALSAVGERLLRMSGVADPAAALSHLQRATIDNVQRLGPQAALTGPAVRGDVDTVERHLAALAERAPDAVVPYVALCRLQLDLAAAAARLAPERRDAVEEVLARWT